MGSQEGADRRTFLAACGAASLALIVAPPWARARQKVRDEIWLDNNENPLGPSPLGLAALEKAARGIHRYPDFESEDLRLALARHHRVQPNQIVMGCGSTEVLHQAILAHLTPGDEMVTAAPDFWVPEIFVKRAGAVTRAVPVRADHRVDLAGLTAKVSDRTKLIYFSNPLNPLGTYVAHRDIQEMLAKLPASVTTLVDEAYFEYITTSDYGTAISLVRDGQANLIVTRTFSKAYGLAGLRVGYGVASADLASRLAARAIPVSVNLLAQVTALAAIVDDAHIAKTRKAIDEARVYTHRELKRLNIDFIPSASPFTAFRVSDPKKVRAALKQQKIHIDRPVDANRYAGYLRLSIGTVDEMTQALSALKELL